MAIRSIVEIEAMRAAGRVVHAALEAAARTCAAGATTAMVDAAASAEIARGGARPIFLGYPAESGLGAGVLSCFPAATCVSVNEELIHGIPGPGVLVEGDLVSIDCGASIDGWCADAAITVAVRGADAGGAAALDLRRQHLVRTTSALLEMAIAAIRPGRAWSGIAAELQRAADAAGLTVVTDYVGHGIGRHLHESPEVPCHAIDPLAGRDFTLRPGMTLAIEPMLTLGSGRTRTRSDGWTVVTADGLPAAHFEHTVAVISDGAEVLTAPPPAVASGGGTHD